jgi:hypothetical protein
MTAENLKQLTTSAESLGRVKAMIEANDRCREKGMDRIFTLKEIYEGATDKPAPETATTN